jgi:hypothetical protein
MPPERRRLSDEEVRRFIREQLAERPTLRQTRVLRLLRESGYSCEQARFKALFVEATARQDAR